MADEENEQVEDVQDTVEEQEIDVEDTGEDEEESVVVGFGDDTEDDVEEVDNSGAMNTLRKAYRKSQKEVKELKKAQVKTEELPALGAEPTLEDCDFDPEAYRDKLRAYDKEKRKHQELEQDVKSKEEARQKAWTDRLGEYEKGLAVFDEDVAEDAHDAVKAALSEEQQTYLVSGFGEQAATLVVGLGSDDTRLSELAKITDPLKFIIAATELKLAMKVTKRKPKTSPETRVTGHGAGAVGDKTLEKLEKEADKTGDRSKIQAFHRAQRLAS